MHRLVRTAAALAATATLATGAFAGVARAADDPCQGTPSSDAATAPALPSSSDSTTSSDPASATTTSSTTHAARRHHRRSHRARL